MLKLLFIVRSFRNRTNLLSIKLIHLLFHVLTAFNPANFSALALRNCIKPTIISTIQGTVAQSVSAVATCSKPKALIVSIWSLYFKYFSAYCSRHSLELSGFSRCFAIKLDLFGIWAIFAFSIFWLSFQAPEPIIKWLIHKASAPVSGLLHGHVLRKYQNQLIEPYCQHLNFL